MTICGPGASLDAIGDFIVAPWEKNRKRSRDLRRVQAKSAEEAVAMVAASRTLTKEGVVYEVWPAEEPGCILRITLKPREPGPASTSEAREGFPTKR